MTRVAVCQEWMTMWAGSEQVAARLAHVLDADHVFTFGGDQPLLDKAFPGRTVTTARASRLPVLRRVWRYLLPLMSWWWKHLDLRGFDVVVTCSHATVNSIRVPAGALHVSYCCTPMRYAWMWRAELGRVPGPLRPIWPVVAYFLRRTDRRRARNVDRFLAVSHPVEGRISRWYGRDATVVYPPVDTEFFTPGPATEEGYYLFAGRLVGYKRPDLAVRAAEVAGVRLIVAGRGPELASLRRIASEQIEFRESPTSEELRDLYRGATALVFPGAEDFGMVMVEAQACGTPVIAFRADGATDAVVNGRTGVLFDDPSPEAIANVLRTFDRGRFEPDRVRSHAERFSVARFDQAIADAFSDVSGLRIPRA